MLFPSNPALARILADRCSLLVGVDPDPTIEENPFVHERVRASIEGFLIWLDYPGPIPSNDVIETARKSEVVC